MKNFLKLILIFSINLTLYSKTLDSKDKIFGSSPPMTYLIYALNPDKLLGLNFNPKNINNDANSKFLKQSFFDLPVIGSLHGGGENLNIETIINYNPKLILIWEDDYLFSTVKTQITKAKIPTLTIPFRKIESMPESIMIAAKAIDEEKRGEELASYAKQRIEYISTIAKSTKATRYYYAEGVDGLSTECDNSFHVEAINFVGGENVHKCTQSGVLGLEKISFEKLLEYDPQIIIAQNRAVYEHIYSNPLWQHLSAVKNKRVILVPNTPFNWIDRPPSFMRIVGIEWLAYNFYSNLYKADFKGKVKEFYKLFLGIEIDDEDIKKIINKESK